MRKQYKSLKERKETFRNMKNKALNDFKNGGDPSLIGQMLILIETVELKDTGKVSKLKSKLDLSEERKKILTDIKV